MADAVFLPSKVAQTQQATTQFWLYLVVLAVPVLTNRRFTYFQDYGGRRDAVGAPGRECRDGGGVGGARSRCLGTEESPPCKQGFLSQEYFLRKFLMLFCERLTKTMKPAD